MPDAEPLCSLGTADNTVFDSDGQAKLLAIDNNINGVTIAEIDSSDPKDVLIEFSLKLGSN